MAFARGTERAGITRIDFIVVCILCGTLFLLLMPVVLTAQEKAKGQESLEKLKKMALACHSANDMYRKLPPAWGKYGQSPAGYQSVHYHLLPYLKEQDLYKKYEPSAKVSVFLCDEDPGAEKSGGGIQNYAANLRVFTDYGVINGFTFAGGPKFNDLFPKGAPPFDPKKSGPDGPFGDEPYGGNSRISATFVDGTSNTIIFGTRFANNTSKKVESGKPNCSAHFALPYSGQGAFFGQLAAKTTANADTAEVPTFQLAPQPTKVDCSGSHYAHSFAATKIPVVFADASARFISSKISARGWNQALQPNDGQIPELGEGP
ncbi:MAG: DUF1559 domain-containing protein [Planctomycetes bacterium]|nr:DUF1559 domain-containing protein [Planctomycetota bacterium]